MLPRVSRTDSVAVSVLATSVTDTTTSWYRSPSRSSPDASWATVPTLPDPAGISPGGRYLAPGRLDVCDARSAPGRDLSGEGRRGRNVRYERAANLVSAHGSPAATSDIGSPAAGP